MKRLLMLLLPAALTVSCARTTEMLSSRELQDLISRTELFPVGTYFWDEFGKYRDQYNLNDEESMLLGQWRDIDGAFSYSYCFFPNRLFICTIIGNYRDDPARAIENALGTWFIRDNAVYARIYGFNEVRGRTRGIGDKDAEHKYITVEPYEVKIVNFREILGTGYTRNYFNSVNPPKPLRERLTIPRRSRKELREGLKDGVGMVRFLYENYIIPRPHRIFGLFSLVPRLADDNVSGLDIVTNPALVEEYFVKSLTYPYEDYGSSEEWGID